MSKRVAFDDDAMWWLLGVVVGAEDEAMQLLANPNEDVQRMEGAGYLWLRTTSHACMFNVQPTREGIAAAHRWAARRAKEAALQFGAPRG